MEYDELIDKIKDALKITKLEIYEKADLQAILKEAWLDGYETGFDEAEEDAREISIIKLKHLTTGFLFAIMFLQNKRSYNKNEKHCGAA